MRPTVAFRILALDRICTIYTSFQSNCQTASASSTTCLSSVTSAFTSMSLAKVLLFVHWPALQVRVYFGVVENFEVQLQMGPSFNDRFVKGIFDMERRNDPTWSRPVAIISQFALVGPAACITERCKQLDEYRKQIGQ